MDDILILLFFFVLGATIWFAPLVLSIIALRRIGRVGEMQRRLARLERLVDSRAEIAAGTAATPEPVQHDAVEAAVAPAAVTEAVRPAPRAEMAARPAAAVDWESFIGRRTLGWIAGLLLVLAAAFFMRYAIENKWIGPLGRVALAVLVGIAVAGGGWHYYKRGWLILSPMCTGAGVVVFYLATYTSFGFYNLLPRQAATVFLIVIVVESMVLAVLYDRMPLGLVSILGGLITPVLMRSEHDQYLALFTYLAVLDAGVVLLALARDWPAVTSTALVGTQLLFWMWYSDQYHPEKRVAAIIFQLIVFGLFLGYELVLRVARRRPAGVESLGRWLVNPFCAFLVLYIALLPDHAVWMGTLAVTWATVYAILARLVLATRPEDDGLFVASLAVAVSFGALAFPIQADAAWITLGWAAEAAALWWFGARLGSPTLRILAGALAVVAVGRLIAIDSAAGPREPFVPIVNRYALPSLTAAACLLGALVSTRRFMKDRELAERRLVIAAGIAGVVAVGGILSVDLYRYCELRAHIELPGAEQWHRIAQVTLSVLWAVYATIILTVGFRTGRVWLRWTALVWYGVTLLKVFLIDLAGLDELYRVLAFVVLALALGVAARAYQGLRPGREPARQLEGGTP
jgi:uncharacterized membrane protein